MTKAIWLSLIILLCSGCAGTGFDKKATLMPDEFWTTMEVSPTGAERDYKTSKIVGGLKWKLSNGQR